MIVVNRSIHLLHPTSADTDVKHVMYATGWRENRSIIYNCGTTSLSESPYIRRRHRKVPCDGVCVTETTNLEISRRGAIFEFFVAFAKIDIHDHIRQGILEMERFWLCKN